MGVIWGFFPMWKGGGGLFPKLYFNLSHIMVIFYGDQRSSFGPKCKIGCSIFYAQGVPKWGLEEVGPHNLIFYTLQAGQVIIKKNANQQLGGIQIWREKNWDLRLDDELKLIKKPYSPLAVKGNPDFLMQLFIMEFTFFLAKPNLIFLQFLN